MVQDDDSNNIHSCKTPKTSYMMDECWHQHCRWKGNFVCVCVCVFCLSGNGLDNIY